jgi:hypothetical protein
MTENSASLGVLPRASPTRNEPTSRGGVSTTFQAGQSLPMCASLSSDKAVIWRMSGKGADQASSGDPKHERPRAHPVGLPRPYPLDRMRNPAAATAATTSPA